MKISDLASDTPLQKIAEAKLSNGDGRNLWDLNFGSKEERKKKRELLKKGKHARIYIIAVDEEIYKIGCSEAAGGLKGTIDSYRCGNTGTLSDRTHGIHIFITEQLLKNKKVEFYGYNAELSPITTTDIQGNKITKMASPQAKLLEEISIEAYQMFESKHFNKEGAFPPWNLQEAHKKWPEYIKEGVFDLEHSNKSVTLESIKKRLGL